MKEGKHRERGEEIWKGTYKESTSYSSVFLFDNFLKSCSVQIRLSHQRPLAVGTPVLPALNSPVWMDPVSPLTW